MAENKNFRYILLTTNLGMNKIHEVFENSESAMDVVEYYNKYYIKRDALENLRNSIKENIPSAVELTCFGSVGYAVPQKDYYDGLANAIKILGNNFIFGKFNYEKTTHDFNDKSKEYKFLCQNQFDFEDVMYNAMISEINLYNRNLNEKSTGKEEEIEK